MIPADIEQKSTTTVQMTAGPTTAKLKTTTENRLLGMKDIWNMFNFVDEGADEVPRVDDSIQQMLDAILLMFNQGKSQRATTTTVKGTNS